MGSIRRQAYYKPVPDGAEILTRGGKRIARWTGRTGERREAPVTQGPDGSLRVRLLSSRYVARFRDSDGRWVEQTTGCTNKEAAKAVLGRWEREEERIQAGERY